MTDQGKQGEQGSAGERGRQGGEGDIGARGQAGVAGRQGEPGQTGRQGEVGQTGQRGPQGPSGDISEAVDAAKALTATLAEQTTVLGKVLIRQRWQTVAIALVLVLSLVLGAYAIRANNAADTAKKAITANCEANNKIRTGLLDVADFLEELGGADPDPDLVALVARMRRNFALRDCAKAVD